MNSCLNTPFKYGDAEIRRVEEMTIRSPISTLTRDERILSDNLEWLAPRFLNEDGTRDFVFQSWILTIDSKVIVVDPCNGNGRAHPLALFDNLNTPYLERFEASGIRPQDVDIVFCTHLHHDHCGWSTRLQNGIYVPTFPKALYFYVRREYERWRHSPQHPGGIDLNIGVFDCSVKPIFDAGLAVVVNDQYRLTRRLTVEAATGHTAGHSILHLNDKDNGTHAIFTGDVFHHPLQMIYPELCMPGDDDRHAAVHTRNALVSWCLDHNALVLPAHFPRPYAGYVRKIDGETRFVPLDGDTF